MSDTLAAALWVLDFMFTLASAGCAGVNMETGVNQRGFISSYSPIGDDEQAHYWAAPEYYGMLAFAQSGVGRLIGSTIDAGDRNVKAYATQPGRDRIVVTLINKEASYDAMIVIEARRVRTFSEGVAGSTLGTFAGEQIRRHFGRRKRVSAGVWNSEPKRRRQQNARINGRFACLPPVLPLSHCIFEFRSRQVPMTAIRLLNSQ